MEFTRGKLAKELEDPFYLKDPKLSEYFEKCKPPKEAYFYFPKGEEIIVLNKKKLGSSYRKIYYDVPVLSHEVKYMNELKQIIAQHPEVKLPDFFDDELLLRFLYADDCEMDKVFKRMKKYIEWSNKTFPLVIEPKSKIIEILNKGFIYSYGRDSKFRPIIIFRLIEFIKYEKVYSVEEVVNAGIFFGQFIINHMLLPGKIERWDMIINLRKAHLLALPEHIKKLLPIMNEGFISRLNKTYVIGMNFFFRLLYKIVCAFLHESTVKKIMILDGKKDQRMFKEIRSDNVEMDMGGTAPNARLGEENGIFPPRMPSDKFLLDEDRPEDILMSEDEYIKKYKRGEINKDFVSPYILKKLNEENISSNDDKVSVKIMEKNNTISNKVNDVGSSNNILPKLNINNNFKTIDNEIFIRRPKIIKENWNKMCKVNTFINKNWESEEENTNIEKYSSKTNSKSNLINEFISLRNKRNYFFSHITKISNIININI